MSEKDLTIIDLPALRFQVHCHEGSNEGKTSSTHIKEYGSDKHIPLINSYQFAMGQIYAESLGIDVIKK